MGSTTTVNALPYPAGSDANNVPADIQALADRVDTGSIIERMSTATRDALAAGRKVAGVVIYNSTTQTLQKYNGSTWDDVALIASPTFTGTPAAPTAAVDTNTTQLATTAFVVGQAASATPLIDGTAAVGTSTRYARGDHVHPAPGAWTSYTPTFTWTGASWTYTKSGSYCQIGKVVHFRAVVVLSGGSAGSPSAGPQVGLPVNCIDNADGTNGALYHCRILDSGTAWYSAAAGGNGTANSVTIAVPGTNGIDSAVTSSIPHSWAVGDKILVSGTYEAA